MTKLYGLPLEQAIKALENERYTVIEVEPPRPREAGTPRVVRVKRQDPYTVLYVCAFLDCGPRGSAK